MKLLKKGSTGNEVEDLQDALDQAGYGVKVTKTFDDKTERAVLAFQHEHGLVEDGKVGQQTWRALIQFNAPPSKSARKEPDKSAMSTEEPPVTGGTDKVGALPPPNHSSLQLLHTARSINEIIIHCTATPEGKDYTVDDIRAWHKQRGFSDIGYHYVVYRDGRIMPGRPIGQVGAHVEGHNTGTIGISYVGGLTADAKKAKDTRTKDQRSSLLWLVQKLVKDFNVKKVTGHNQYAAKACPSFDVRKDQLSQLV